ncbi:MAG TPA: transferrin receptor-like dimerization domain-containing protein [Gemmatimonadaceae bacterium]|nr:transferrin receptor-like dimerization domain-containing protein [Gemmatimonadaceae bacterium]
MSRFSATTLLPFALVPALMAATAPRLDDPPPIRGFSAASSKIQREWEGKFRAIPDPARMREAMRRLAARPHHLGSAYGKENAEWMKAQFESYGWEAKLERFDVLFPTPKVRVLELVGPTRFTAKLEEPILKEDPATSQRAEQLPTYNAYSGDGDVTAPLVYVNYGVPADYEELERRGISVKGAIVIARYGGSWRGIKPKVAHEHGAVGAIIYSDPKDDGYAEGETYPNGPYRPKDGVQRGSVLDMPTYPGDPLTPGVGATANAKRLDRQDAITIMKIPVLPISYADAQPLLAALTGPVAPPSWRGGLPITYRMGPGAAKVHLKLEFDWKLTPLYNVIATLKGAELPDEWVMRGNHHDGWVNGAEDPISGMVAELEEARALGELVKQGWRPRRTIVYAAWDGEEPSLLGSTEWVEEHMGDMRSKGVFYLNTDGNGRGFFGAAGSHALERFVTEVANEVVDPETNVSIMQRLRAAQILQGDAEARTRREIRLEALGSGSDFTPFLQHAGVPTLNIGFGGEDGGGIYHSIYDTFTWYTRFSDTSFVYGRALAQAAGMMVMRVANADVLPAEFGGLSATAARYLGEVTSLRERTAKEIDELNRRIAEGTYAAVNDPRRPLKAPSPQEPAPHLNFSPIQNAVDSLQRSAERYERAYGTVVSGAATQAALGRVNALLRQSDQALLIPEGLPRRPWYQHALYAPGYYTGYGVKTMPGVREAIEQKEWGQAQEQVAKIAAALLREGELVAKAAKLLEDAGKPIP